MCYNAAEGWGRDATSDIADALAERAANTDAEISPALQAFIRSDGTKPFDLHAADAAAAAAPSRLMATGGKPLG